MSHHNNNSASGISDLVGATLPMLSVHMGQMRSLGGIIGYALSIIATILVIIDQVVKLRWKHRKDREEKEARAKKAMDDAGQDSEIDKLNRRLADIERAIKNRDDGRE